MSYNNTNITYISNTKSLVDHYNKSIPNFLITCYKRNIPDVIKFLNYNFNVFVTSKQGKRCDILTTTHYCFLIIPYKKISQNRHNFFRPLNYVFVIDIPEKKRNWEEEMVMKVFSKEYVKYLDNLTQIKMYFKLKEQV